MKRFARLATMAVAALVVLLGSNATATARPVSYPVTGGCSQVLVSSTVVPAGGQLTVSGVDFVPGAHLAIEWHSTVVVLAHVTVSSDGTFSVVVTVPADAVGSHTITVSGATGEVCLPDPIQVTSLGTGGHTSGPPSITGVAIATLLIVAACLMLVGYFLNASGSRKRKHGRHHTPRHQEAV